MTVQDTIAATTISRVWIALGGEQPMNGRSRAFYRDGDNRSAVAISDEKGAWYDHPAGTGGGVLDLIQHVLDCDRPQALKWLAEFTGRHLDDNRPSLEQRRDYARRKANARRQACDIEHWRGACVTEMEDRKVTAMSAGDDTALADAASLCNILTNGSAADVVREYYRHQARDSADVARLIALGAEDEAEARRITRQVVLLLCSQPEDGIAN